MSSFDSDCPRCKNVGTTQAVTPATTQTQNNAPTINGTATGLMGGIGIILMCLGILGACYFFLFFNTTVSTDFGDVVNIGLLSDRQNGIIFCFGFALIGCFLFYMDRSNTNKKPITDTQKKGMIFTAIGLLVLLALSIVLLFTMGNNVKNTFGDPTAAALDSPSPELVRQSDASSLKQLAFACFNFEGRHGDIMPDMSSAEAFKIAVTPYMDKSSPNVVDIFVQSDTQDPFQPNPALSKIADGNINNPREIAMIYQNTPYSDGTRNVVFLDGHIKLISGDDWVALKQQSGIP